MRKIILFMFAVLLICSCAISQPSIIANYTKEDIEILITYADGTVKEYEIRANSKLYDFNWIDITQIRSNPIDSSLVIKRPNNKTILIDSLELSSYTVKVIIPSSAFDGSDSLYLAERDNRIERYPSGLTTKKIDADSFFAITSYGRDFYLCDETGKEKTTLNGCPIAIRQEGSTYFIY